MFVPIRNGHRTCPQTHSAFGFFATRWRSLDLRRGVAQQLG